MDIILDIRPLARTGRSWCETWSPVLARDESIEPTRWTAARQGHRRTPIRSAITLAGDQRGPQVGRGDRRSCPSPRRARRALRRRRRSPTPRSTPGPNRVVHCDLTVGGFPDGRWRRPRPTASGTQDGGGPTCRTRSAFEEAELADLDDAAPWARSASGRSRRPPALIRGPQRLVDERRYDVPVTVNDDGVPRATLLRGAGSTQGINKIAPVARIRPDNPPTLTRGATTSDLPTAPLAPQFSRPVDLGRAIATGPIGYATRRARPVPEPAESSARTEWRHRARLFLDHERASIAWADRGRDAGRDGTGRRPPRRDR
jgi:hypothetical protein